MARSNVAVAVEFILPVRVLPAPVHGEYRCYWPNEWNRPCNKFLGRGAGEFARRCPRCKRQCAFENPNVLDR